MDIKERVYQIRQDLSLSQEAFGKRIGVGRSAVSNYESGGRNITEQVIKSIVREFGINEEWLKKGTGEMFIETKDSFIHGLVNQYDLDDIDKRILESYISLPAEERAILKKYIHSLAGSLNDEIAATVDEVLEENQSIAEDEEDSIEKELNAYRLELEAEKKGQISSVLEDVKNIEGKTS